MEVEWSVLRGGGYEYVRTYPTKFGNLGTKKHRVRLAIVAGCRDSDTMQAYYRATILGSEAVRFGTKEDAMRWVEATVVLQQE
jgi:hypothetical protein